MLQLPGRELLIRCVYTAPAKKAKEFPRKDLRVERETLRPHDSTIYSPPKIRHIPSPLYTIPWFDGPGSVAREPCRESSRPDTLQDEAYIVYDPYWWPLAVYDISPILQGVVPR